MGLDGGWDNLLLRNISPLKMKIFRTPRRIQNFKVPTPPNLSVGRGGQCAPTMLNVSKFRILFNVCSLSTLENNKGPQCFSLHTSLKASDWMIPIFQN